MDISEDIKLQSGLVIYRNWEHEGAIYMRNAKTIDRYKEIQNEQNNADLNGMGIFFAFTDKQYDEGYQDLIDRGIISREDKIYRLPISGGFGTKAGYEQMMNYYSSCTEKIRKECDPQEVYFYQWNNHECMIAYDGDLDAIRYIYNIWGEKVARNIVRYREFCSIDQIIKEEAA